MSRMDGSKYSVLHIGKFYPPHAGGMETHLHDLAVRQTQEANVRVVVSNSAARSEVTVSEGVEVWRVARIMTIASMPVCPQLITAIRACPSDVVHIHMPNPGAAAAFLLSGHIGKLVLTHHADTLGRRMLRLLSDPFVRETMNRASAIIATSSGYLNSSAELVPYRHKCHVIPLGIDLVQLHGNGDVLPELFREVSGLPMILAIGRLVPYKGFDVLIRAMQHVEAKLIVIGTGPEEHRLKALIQQSGVQDKVELAGRVERIQPYLNAASIFVMPSISRAEAFGLAQLEAMAAGLPVINTRINSGVPEVSVDGETGLTVEPENETALAEAIQKLLSDLALRRRFGVAAQARVSREYSADCMTDRTLKLYRGVLE